MASGDILRLFVIAAGAYMLVKAVLSLAKRKMTEPFCLAWVLLSALMILSGVLLNPSQLDHKRTDPDHHRCIRNFMGTVVYKHPGIPSEKTESGNGHADITFKQRL